MSKSKGGYSRREFLKVIGAGSSLAAAGCGQDLPTKLIPYVVQPDEIIPGVATWYTGSCGECSAGCGVIVRVRDGRATKSEGNPNHPLNKGGLCAFGQSSIQSHYDPDRVREPLAREVAGAFKATEWKSAVDAVAGGLKNSAEKDVLLLTGPLTGSIKSLIAEFGGKFPKFTHIEYEALSRDTLDQGAAKTFGPGVTTHFDLSKADVLVSFGADYLETWLSPVEFSKQWSERRRPAKGQSGRAEMSYSVHFEPRLSPTAGSVDRWVMNRPGTEAYLLGTILKSILEKKSGQLPGGLVSKLKGELAGFGLEQIEARTGVPALTVTTVVERLLGAQQSLVIAGGASCSSPFPIECAVLANLINAALGNIGKSVILRTGPKTEKTAVAALAELAEEAAAGKRKLGTVIISGTNPLYSLPPGHPLRKALAKADMVVAVSSQLDETTEFANVVLPLSTNFEAWNDAEPAPGVYNLNQPAMAPLYKTLSLGDALLAIGLKLDFTIEGVKSFEDYLKREWRKRTGDTGFADRWDGYVEKGGDWSGSKISASASPNFNSSSGIDLAAVAAQETKGAQLLAFPTTLSVDGRSGNRAWMQEVPYPMTTSVWGSWIEIHPDTAKKFNVGPTDVMRIQTAAGEIEAPAFYSKHIHPDLVATPLGKGHDSYGRYAAGVGANPVRLLSADVSSGAVGYLTPLAEGQVKHDSLTQSERKFPAIVAVHSKEKLVVFSGNREEPSDSQLGRGLIRSVPLAKLSLKQEGSALADSRLGQSVIEDHGHNGKGQPGHDKHGAEHNDHESGHHDPLALGPQEEPPQMYEQMDHPLYRWGMSIDLNVCTGCSACVVACYAENNIAVVGKEISDQGREMSWIRIERYFDGDDDQPLSGFLPMMCQHCNNAPCEPVCPVYATYHNEEGINTMVYNRCVGTRYCLNNCSYKVRRFNFFKYDWPEPLTWQLNPDVTVRSVGVMEKCNLCHHRIMEAKGNAKNEGRLVRDGEIVTACQATCPTDAIRFGNLQDKHSAVYADSQNERSYKVLDQYINTQPGVVYLAKAKHTGQIVEHAAINRAEDRGEA